LAKVSAIDRDPSPLPFYFLQEFNCTELTLAASSQIPIFAKMMTLNSAMNEIYLDSTKTMNELWILSLQR
jgi:hypothetical protein